MWFASAVAAALYSLGFGAFFIQSVLTLWPDAPPLLGNPRAPMITALLAVAVCTVFLKRTPGSGGNMVNVLKVAVFAVLIIGGAMVWFRVSPPAGERLTPFLPGGPGSLVAAMGLGGSGAEK